MGRAWISIFLLLILNASGTVSIAQTPGANAGRQNSDTLEKPHSIALIRRFSHSKQDERIQHGILDEISKDPELNVGTVVEVELRHGDAFVKGITGTQDQKNILLKLIRNYPGVVSLREDVLITRQKGALRTEASTCGDDLDLVARVRNTLLTEGLLEGNDVAIYTRQKVVTLRGVVRTGKQADRMVALTQGVSGVTKVDDQLKAQKGKRHAS